MVYICAWQAAALPPEALISSRMTLAAVRERPRPPCSSGMSAASHPCSVRAATNSSGYRSRLERAPVLAGKPAQSARTAARISVSESSKTKSTRRL